jgi:outer membrane protein OmpA-like peptidoglycan-associated protein
MAPAPKFNWKGRDTMDISTVIRPVPMLVMALVISACSTMPERDAALDSARAARDAARDDADVRIYAALEYKRADDDFHRAEAAWQNREPVATVDHLAYLAERRAEIAQETGHLKAAEAAIGNATAERDRIQLDARTQQAEAAQRQARIADLRAQVARQQATDAQLQAAVAEQQAQQSRMQAMVSQQQALESDARSRALVAQLDELQARMTDRGMVITLGDVLFDSGSAHLREQGLRAVGKLAAFMQQYPRRMMAIEGYTDSVGSESYNQDLSERRASAIRIALTDAGVSPERITVRGYGKAFPVASNTDATGRQLNRRVEVVISDDSGHVPPGRA